MFRDACEALHIRRIFSICQDADLRILKLECLHAFTIFLAESERPHTQKFSNVSQSKKNYFAGQIFAAQYKPPVFSAMLMKKEIAKMIMRQV